MAKYPSERENRADEVAGKKATDKDHLLQQVLFDLVQTDTIKNSLTLGSHILKKIKPVHKLQQPQHRTSGICGVEIAVGSFGAGGNLVYHQPGRRAAVRQRRRFLSENRHSDC